MNIIAAIVFPLDDGSLQSKYDSGNSLLLKKDDRVKLWRGEAESDFFWVYPDNEANWRAFQRNLIQILARDGIELRFSLLCGPDHLRDTEEFLLEPWNCKEIICSDISRDSAITATGNMELRQLDLYHPWKRSVIDCELVRKISESEVPGLFMGESESVNEMVLKGESPRLGIELMAKLFFRSEYSKP